MNPPNNLNDLERVVGSLSGEAALMESGTDEGLIPFYSLLGDLEPLLAEDGGAQAALAALREELGGVLDAGGSMSGTAIGSVEAFVETLQCFLRYLRMGEAVEWSFVEGAANAGAGSGAGAESEAPVDGADEPEPAGTATGTGSGAPLAAAPDESEALLVFDLEESRDILEEFYQEAVEHLENIEAALLEMEDPANAEEAISSIFRSFHTIKGVAGFLELGPIQALAHEVETLLDLVRSGTLEFTDALVNLVLESRDRLQLQVGQVQRALEVGEQPDEVIVVGDLIRRTQGFLPGKGEAGESEQPVTAGASAAVVEEAPDLSEEGGETGGATFAMGGEAVPEGPSVEVREEKVERAKAGGGKKLAESIRMNTEKLDAIIDAVGELVIVESQLRDSTNDLEQTSSRIERNLAQLGRITRELQRTGLSLRMVSLKQTFQKMQRLARDLSTKSGKKVLFEVEGEDTEMDRTVVEKIGDPLVHMIRNAMDHGIEGPEERQKAGKSPMGHVLLQAYYQGDNIVIELTDDGRGIVADKVLKKAISRGLAEEGKQYTRQEIIELLFMPGFSTAENVSDISGRGVGMDVVRSNVQNLRGKVELKSEEGKGSQAKISLPLTMAIIDGLLVRVGKERYILPVSNVNMTLKPEKKDLYKVQGKGQVIQHREEIYQLVHLGTFFGVEADSRDPAEGVVVMVESARGAYGLVVDELLHKQEVVVKNLGGSMTHPEGVSGGAILGDGTIALILDPAGFEAR